MFWVQKKVGWQAVLVMAVAVPVLAACGDGSTPEPASALPTGGGSDARSYPYRVTATTGMVADIVRQVAGDRGSVVSIIGEGVDPHLYVPTRSDVAALMEADIVFYSGLLLEGKMTDTLIKVAGSRPVHAVTELVDESLLLQPSEFAGHFDPHLWMDVSGWTQAVHAVTEALVAFDPEGAGGYRERATDYTATLGDLHAYALRTLGSIPEQQRMLVTAHDAFNYFGRAYGLEVAGIQGISTESEAGLDRINRLVDLLVTRAHRGGVRGDHDRRTQRPCPDRGGGRARPHRGGGRRAVLGRDGAAGNPTRGTYVGMLDHNVTTVARALGGDAPEGGFQGLLSHSAGDGP